MEFMKIGEFNDLEIVPQVALDETAVASTSISESRIKEEHTAIGEEPEIALQPNTDEVSKEVDPLDLSRELDIKEEQKPPSCDEEETCGTVQFECSPSNTSIDEVNGERAKPFSCSKCDFTTSYKTSFLRHMRSHSGEKPSSCSKCDYKALRKTCLLGHRSMHTDRNKRGTNFTSEERRVLIALACRYTDVLENKKTDNVTSNAKHKVWELIHSQFNAEGLGPHRDIKSLRFKYESIKRELRKTNNEDCKATGGGPCSMRHAPLTNEEVILKDIISLSYKGLVPNCGDSNVGNPRVSLIEVQEEGTVLESHLVDVDVDINWSDAHPPVLETEKNSALVVTPSPELIPPCSSPPGPSCEVTSQPLIRTNASVRRRSLKRKSDLSAAAKFEKLAEKKLKLLGKKEMLLDLQIAEAEINKRTAEINKETAEINREAARRTMQSELNTE